MKDFFSKLLGSTTAGTPELKDSEEDKMLRRVTALYGLYSALIGPEKVILKAGKLDALTLMRSEKLSERVLGLQRLVFEDPTLAALPIRSRRRRYLTSWKRSWPTCWRGAISKSAWSAK